MKKLLKDPYLWIFLLFAVYPLLPYIGNFTSLGTELLLWFIFTLSFNLCLGYTGLPSFGHGAFYGVGSYAAALTFLYLSGKGGVLFSAAHGGSGRGRLCRRPRLRHPQ